MDNLEEREVTEKNWLLPFHS